MHNSSLCVAHATRADGIQEGNASARCDMPLTSAARLCPERTSCKHRMLRPVVAFDQPELRDCRAIPDLIEMPPDIAQKLRVGIAQDRVPSGFDRHPPG